MADESTDKQEAPGGNPGPKETGPMTTAAGTKSEVAIEHEQEETAQKKKQTPQQLMMAILLVLVAVGILVFSIVSTPDPLARYKVKPTVQRPPGP